MFSEFQGARTMEPGQAEITPALTYASTPQSTVSVHAAYGIMPRMAMRARFTHVFVHWESDVDTSTEIGSMVNEIAQTFEKDFSVVSAGPKLSLVEERLAIFVPAGLYFGSDLKAGGFHVQPALLVTLPVADRFELNPSVNAMLPGGLVAVNLGAAIGTLERWAVRPEIGVLVNDPAIVSFGIGFSFWPSI